MKTLSCTFLQKIGKFFKVFEWSDVLFIVPCDSPTVVILSNVFIISCSFLCPNPVSGPSSSLVQDTCLGRMRSWVQIPAASPPPQQLHPRFSRILLKFDSLSLFGGKFVNSLSSINLALLEIKNVMISWAKILGLGWD